MHLLNPAILDLPDQVLNDLCTVLDSSAEHNWRRLVEHIPDYTHMDVMELRNIAQQVAGSDKYEAEGGGGHAPRMHAYRFQSEARFLALQVSLPSL